MARVLIAGAGYVGSALARRLVERGHRVWAVRRSAWIEPPPEVTPLRADLGDRATVEAALDASLAGGIDWLVYTASAGRGGQAPSVAYARGLEIVLQSVGGRDGPPSRLVYTSSTGVYGHCSGEWVNEASEARPADPAGEAMLAGEAMARSAPGGVVLRLAGIYGPGRTRLIDSVRDGTARRTAAIEHTNRIHREDCVGAIEHLLTHPRPDSIYLGADHEPTPKNAVLEYLAERLGVPPPPIESSPPVGARHERGHKRCDGARLRASGYRFIYPTFREGYDGLLAT